MSNDSKPLIMTITGPSLSGKSTLANYLLEKFKNYQPVVTHTTREMREGEENGKSYHFVSKEEFKNLIDNNKMVEFAEVGPRGKTQFYGTSLQALNKVLSSGKIPILVIEPQGAHNVNKYIKENKTIDAKLIQVFITNPKEILFERFLQRFSNDSKATIDNYTKRLLNMVEVEPKEWIEPALQNNSIYNLKFTHFNNESTDYVINSINDYIKDNYLINIVSNIENKNKLRC